MEEKHCEAAPDSRPEKGRQRPASFVQKTVLPETVLFAFTPSLAGLLECLRRRVSPLWQDLVMRVFPVTWSQREPRAFSPFACLFTDNTDVFPEHFTNVAEKHSECRKTRI